MKDTTFPFEHGPNWGCPRPIVPLTNDKSVIDTAIDGMLSYYSTGTFIPTGLVWGWHVLSPTEPFTEGIQPDDPNYARTTKAVLLFTDGANVVSGTNNHNRSRFSGYNYTGLQVGGTYRLGSPNASDGRRQHGHQDRGTVRERKGRTAPRRRRRHPALHDHLRRSCPSADEALMRDCASLDEKGNHLYFHAPSTGDLQGIFSQIGEDLSTLHLDVMLERRRRRISPTRPAVGATNCDIGAFILWPNCDCQRRAAHLRSACVLGSFRMRRVLTCRVVCGVRHGRRFGGNCRPHRHFELKS